MTSPEERATARAAILCGGLATRLGSIAKETPKLLLPVAGRPFGAWLFERLRASGLSDVVLCVGHLAGAIEAFAGDGSAFGLRVRYAHDGPAPLGTGGSLRAALPLLASEFLVTYGDSYLPFDYGAPLRELEGHPRALGAMAVFPNRDRFEPSNVAVHRGWVARYDKARSPGEPPLDHIDYGATALRKSAFDDAPASGAFGLDLVQARLAAAHKLCAVVVHERFYEIGSPEGLAELDAHLRGGSDGGSDGGARRAR